MSSYAHSAPEGIGWEPLFTPFGHETGFCREGDCEACRLLRPDHGHLNKVAFLCARFAAGMFPAGEARKVAWQWGYLAGLWHDLGKFPAEWQAYLASKSDPHEADITGRLDHATAGAQWAVRAHPVLGHLLAYGIGGHHSGLLDGTANDACQRRRLEKKVDMTFPEEAHGIISMKFPSAPPLRFSDGYSGGMFARMLFSCLVDADFLATEAFMNPAQADIRNETSGNIMISMLDLVEKAISEFGDPATHDVVNVQRRIVVEDCRKAAEWEPGIFSLTVPTGGGKTLSSFLFALKHAIAHGKRRIIYVVPFTSIIEQNAEVIRRILAPLQTDSFTPLIEHHSSLSPDKESTRSRLSAENWDAPVVITTAVQFYESLHAAKTSRCRKLHRIANSVVILDEAQTLPVDFLKPCLRVLQELTDAYQVTTVLCTATQPAVHFHEDEFPIGLRNCREIISDTAALFGALKRVDVSFTGDLSDAALAERLAGQEQVLCIVNRRKHAQRIFRLLPEDEGNYHLSALMCPEHRSIILAEIRERLERKLPVRVVSTQLIEAGVDVDFPVVYRALAGLDSIAQAAGRCNRNGKLSEPGLVYVFRPEDTKAEKYFLDTTGVAAELLELYDDLIGEDAIRHYFDLYYYKNRDRWDSERIMDRFYVDRSGGDFPFDFKFKTVAMNFKLIDDWQKPVIIPFDAKAEELIGQLRNPSIPLNRELLRGLQRYTVQISPAMRSGNIRSFETLRDGQFYVLISTSLNYSKDFGLTFDEEDVGRQTMIF